MGWFKACVSPRTSASKAVRPRLTSPSEPERISTRCSGAAQLTRHISDGGVVEQAGGEIVLVKAGGRQRPDHRQIVDRQIGAGLQLARRKAGGSDKAHSAEAERDIVIGEAEHGAVATRNFPAPTERRGARGEMGLEGRRERFHTRISTNGIEAISPTRKPARLIGKFVGVETHRDIELEPGSNGGPSCGHGCEGDDAGGGVRR